MQTPTGRHVARAFSKWVSRSDEHKAAFLLVCKTYQKMGMLRSHPIDIGEPVKQPEMGRRWQAAAAAFLGAVALLSLSYYQYQKDRNATDTLKGAFTTRLGEHRCEKLPDGSDVCLNPKTTVHYSFRGNGRNVELVAGEASFVVRKDRRPFDVLAGGLLIRDVSTAFDVYKKSDSTLMTVVDGRVKVAPINAESGWKTAPEFHRLQRIEFDEATGTLHARATLTENGLSQVMAWQRGRIDLIGQRLDEVLQEFARYQPIERFHFQDESLRELRMGGELETTNLMDFLDTLKALHGIRYTLTRDPDGHMTVNLSRRKANPGRRGS